MISRLTRPTRFLLPWAMAFHFITSSTLASFILSTHLSLYLRPGLVVRTIEAFMVQESVGCLFLPSSYPIATSLLSYEAWYISSFQRLFLSPSFLSKSLVLRPLWAQYHPGKFTLKIFNHFLKSDSKISCLITVHLWYFNMD